MIPENKPRNGRNADTVGSYEQCIKLLTPVINQGDVIEVEQYFTGYGMIDGAKIAFYPSSEIFDGKASYIVNGIKQENGKILNGADRFPFTDNGAIIHMQGISRPKWGCNTQFFDVSDDELPQLYTETKQAEAPFKYELKTRRSIKPGNYSLEFVFTYYNGDRWVSSTKNIVFKVQNFLEKHALLIGAIALLASVSALLRFTIMPFVQWLLYY